MTVIEDLPRDLFAKAADVIDEVGWTQGAMKDAKGRVCLTGAIRECAPVPGDWAIVREVANHRNHGETWNDNGSRRKAQVTKWLRETEPITDEELEVVFGPQWEHVVALVRKTATLTPTEWTRYYQARTGTPGWYDAWRAVGDYSGPGDAALRALWAVGGGGDGAGVAAALARRHEIGTAFTQKQYDTLVRPWVSLFGPVHPDDVAA